MARMVRAAIETRTTDLAEWAVPIEPQVDPNSTYRRIQAFFEKFTPDYEDLGRFLLDLVPTDPPHHCTHGYRAKSRFRYGLDRLREIFLNAWRMQAGLHRCRQAVIDPDAFLSSQSGPD